MATPALGPKRRRWYTRPRTFAAVAAVLLGLWLARGPLLGPLVARLAASSLADATGGHAAIAAAGGGWLGDAHASGVTIAGPGAAPAWSLSLTRIEAAYGLGLLRGDLAALHRLDVDGLLVELRPAPSTGQRAAAAWPALFAHLPPTLPQVRIAGEAVLHDGDSLVRISGLDLRLAGERVELSAQRLEVGGRVLALPRCVLRRSAPDAFALAEPMRLELPGLAGPVLCEHLDLILGDGAQRVTADGGIGGGTWRLAAAAGTTRVELRGADLTALGLLPAALGRMAADLDLVQVADGWEIRGLRLAGDAAQLSASAGLRSDPWRCVDLDATLHVDLERLGRAVPALAGAGGRVTATLRGSAGLAPGQWRDSDLRLAIAGDGVVVAGQPCAPAQATLRIARGAIGLEALEVAWNGIHADLAEAEAGTPAPGGAGAWRLAQRPIRCAGGLIRAEGTVDDAGGLAGVVHLDGLPLAGLPGATLLRHAQGTISGRLDLGGTLAHPTWRGALAVDGLEAKFSPSVPTFTAGRARLALADGVLEVTELHGELGGAALDASGRIRLAGGEQRIELACHGRNLLLLQRPDARLRADLDLRLGGTLAVPALSGHVQVASALFTPELHLDGGGGSGDGRLLLFELPDPPWSRMRFDLQVGSAPPVADSDTGVRVVTRWGRGTCDLDLHLGGSGAAPEPQGRVAVRDGVATLPFSTLKVTHGELVFPPGEPFQPRVTAIAGARIRQYDVQVQVTGPLDRPTVQVSGSGLDEQEATLLLTTGSTPRELQAEQGQRAAIGRVGAWLGQETWRSLEGPDDPDAGPSLTERVSIEWGREATSQGRDTIDSEVELTPPGSDPALLLYGKRDRYDEYNAGVILRLYWGGEEP